MIHQSSSEHTGLETKPSKHTLHTIPTELLAKILRHVPDLTTLSQVSKHVYGQICSIPEPLLGKYIRHWLHTDFAFLICCILFRGHFRPESERGQIDVVAAEICKNVDKPLRFELPFNSEAFVKLLLEIVDAVKASVGYLAFQNLQS